MAMVINTNMASINAQRSLGKTQGMLDTAMQRLASGLRINSAKDDAAGLAISTRIDTQIRGSVVASRNASDGISLSQLAEGALDEQTNKLQRMRELAVQAANGTNSSTDRASLQNELVQLKSEFDRVSQTTNFNNVALLDGTFTNKTFQIGAGATESISISIGNLRSGSIGNNTVNSTSNTTGGIASANLGNASGSTIANKVVAQTLSIAGTSGTASVIVTNNQTAKSIADAVNVITSCTNVTATATTTANLSNLSTTGTLSFELYGMNSTAVAISATISSTSDLSNLADAINNYIGVTNISAVSTGGTLTFTSDQGYDIQVANFSASSANTTANFAGGTGTQSGMIENNSTARADSAGVGGTVSFASSKSFSVASNVAGVGSINAGTAAGVAVTSTLASVGALDISTQSGATAAIRAIDGALESVNTERSKLGAIQNRFSSIVANLASTVENLSAANSRIRDADFAKEVANMTKGQILQQAGTSVLSQANSSTQVVLSLLR